MPTSKNGIHFYERDRLVDLPGALKTIEEAKKIQSKYNEIKRQFDRMLQGEPIPEDSPLVTAYLVSLEDMFVDFQVGQRSGLEAIMILCAKYSRRYPDMGEVFRIFAEIRRGGAQTHEISLPALCAAAEIDPADFAGCVISAAILHGQDLGKIKLAAALPKVIDSVITSATELPGREGHADRRLALEMAELINRPQDAPVINITNKIGVGVMPQWEGDKKVVEEVLLNVQSEKSPGEN